MSDRWLDNQSDEQATSGAESFWSMMREDLDAGAFWADEIKKYRGEPRKRLQMAMDNLPFPAAFREAAVATRAIVRSKRKAKETYEKELGLLYWLAAIDSFMIPYAERLQLPGFNVVESIPGKRLRSLQVDYLQLGYNELGLLNKTDKKWMIESWGEPKAHTTLNSIHRQLWDEYENKLIQKRRERDAKFRREMQELIGRGDANSKPHAAKHRTGCLSMIGMIIIPIVVIRFTLVLLGDMT